MSEQTAAAGGEGITLSQAAAAIAAIGEEEEAPPASRTADEPAPVAETPPPARPDIDLAAERDAQERERLQYAQQVRALGGALQQAAQGKYAGIDWVKLSRENPSGYVQLRAQYDADMQRLVSVQAEQARLAAHAQAEHGRRAQAFAEEQSAKLKAALPEYVDRDKGPRLRKELSDYLTGLGFSREEVGGVSDHRAVVVAYKAMLYDRAQKARNDAQTRAEGEPVQRPGAGSLRGMRAADTQEAIAKLRKSGRVAAAAAVIRKLGLGV